MMFLATQSVPVIFPDTLYYTKTHFSFRCPHSKAVQPEWEKASQVLEQQKQYVLGRCNCDGSGKTLCEEFKVSKYPNITLFRHGVFQESFDGRTAGKEP